ncbi:hypothetical protein PIB30_017235 [Stylosanthes scabra]|uniref:Uncharacterized protein n=1 Tax=Stylosanthes scabra TaxID=79078 RepID=A0ABU6Z549_9FABA|nr:hypothetical protein [Stylosanthes scabra]
MRTTNERQPTSGRRWDRRHRHRQQLQGWLNERERRRGKVGRGGRCFWGRKRDDGHPCVTADRLSGGGDDEPTAGDKDAIRSWLPAAGGGRASEAEVSTFLRREKRRE